MAWKLLQDTYVSETLGIPRSTITSFKKRVELGGSLENIPRRVRKSTVSTRDYRKLERLVKSYRRDNFKDITDNFNENSERPVSKRIVQLYLHKNRFVSRVSKKELVNRKVNRKKRLAWCREKRKLTVDN